MDKSIYRYFDNKTVLITGATGFIGGRLLELLAENSSAKIKVLIRDYGKAMRIGRYAIDFIKGDVTDQSSISQAMSGCDVVLHCAYGNKGSEESRNAVNVSGTTNLLQAAKENGVQAFVFLSTMSVYGICKSKELNESCAANPNANDTYAVSKYEAEEAVIDFAVKNNFHATVLQPTAVYGPWSPSYVMRPILQLKQFKFPLINGGAGICNAVYVDDLCQAILLAASNKAAQAQKYLINGREHYTWKEYYESLGKFVADTEFVEVTTAEMKEIFKRAIVKKTVWKTLFKLFKLNNEAVKELLQYKFFSVLFNHTVKKLPPSVFKKLKPSSGITDHKVQAGVKKVMPIDSYYADFLSSSCCVNHSKAVRDLNYNPEFGREQSFEKISEWVKWYYNEVN